MPMYEYQCMDHGTFEALRAIDKRAAPAPCPNCKARSRRILSAPRRAAMERSTLVAHERNERSRHEPRVSRGPNKPKPKPAAEGERPALHVSHGKRPWVLEHG
jgi:putative FmdB family regulatory protein